MLSSFVLIVCILFISINYSFCFVFQHNRFIVNKNNIKNNHKSISSRNMASTFFPSKTTIPNNNNEDDGFHVQPPNDVNQLININDSNFDEIASSEGISVVLFSATWCGPCINMARTLMKCSQSKVSTAKFFQIDTDFNPETASIYSVRSIPCVLLFKDGRVVSEVVGSVPMTVIDKQLAKHSQSWNDENIQSYQ